MPPRRKAAVQRSGRQEPNEFLLILEFIGYRTLIAMAAGGALYFYSGYTNYMDGMSVWSAFSPYYALRFHDTDRLMRMFLEFIQSVMAWSVDQMVYLWNQLLIQLQVMAEQHINPFVEQNPVLGFGLLAVIGFTLSLLLLYISFLVVKASIATVFHSRKKISGKVFGVPHTWDFDPSKKPSDEQLAMMKRNLERFLMRVPALNGKVPKSADATIRELAARNHETDMVYRAAIYVMGPIKGTGYDNSHELPLTLDQVKKLCLKMGNASSYETMPLSLVVVDAKKGSSNWELFGAIQPLALGNSYPMKVVESVMTENRGWFVWDSRVKKSNVGYGIRK